jgi:hypothetical protein
MGWWCSAANDGVWRGKGKGVACTGAGALWSKGAVRRQMRGDAPTARSECDGEEHTCWAVRCVDT